MTNLAFTLPAGRLTLAISLFSLLLTLSRVAEAGDDPLIDLSESIGDTRIFAMKVSRALEDRSTLNQERFEDFRNLSRLTTHARGIKPFCFSLLPEDLGFSHVPVIVRLPPALKPLWLDAVKHPETDLKLEFAKAIERAGRIGSADLTDTIPVLVELLDAEESHRIVRLAAAKSLIALNARDAAPALRKRAAMGSDFAQIIEPALSAWNDSEMQSVWLSRLEDGKSPSGVQILAIRAVAQNQIVSAVPQLILLVSDRRNPSHLRLEAARSLGSLADASVLELVRPMIAKSKDETPLISRLLAAHLLIRQTGDETVRLLQQLARDPEPSVAALACRRLIEIDPELARPLLDQIDRHRDPGLRHLAAEALFLLKTPQDIDQLSEFLSDLNPVIRASTLGWLSKSLEQENLQESISRAVLRVLESEQPRGIAQAAVLVGRFRDESAADRLVELLDHEAADVSIAVAWALRRLAVPSTAEPILRRLEAETAKSFIEIPMNADADLSWTEDLYERHKHLIETLGILRFRPAVSYLAQFAPVPPGKPMNHPFFWVHTTRRPELRARAIRALGRICGDQYPDDLPPILMEALIDETEDLTISAVSALALGEMKVPDAEPVLREFLAAAPRYSESFPRPSMMAHVSRMALKAMTGETVPPLDVDPLEINETGWFLEPLTKSEVPVTNEREDE